MTGIQCPHCGQIHPPESRFCPSTGRALAPHAAPAASPPPSVPPHRPPPGQSTSGLQHPQPPPAAYAAPPHEAYGSPAAPAYGAAHLPAYGGAQQYPYAPQPPAPGLAHPPPAYGPPAYGGTAAPAHGAAHPPAYGGAQQHPYAPQPPAPGLAHPPAYGTPQAHGVARQPAGYAVAPAHAPSSPGGSSSPRGRRATEAKPVGAILRAAFDLYRKNLLVLVATCAVLIVPVALVHAGITALILAPTVAARATASDRVRITQAAADRLRKDVEEAQRDPAKAQQLQRDEQKQLQDLSRTWTATETAAVGGVAAVALGILAMLLSVALLYAIAVPLTTAALTVVVVDRAVGGSLGPAQAYGRLASRLPALLSATIPAFLLVILGLSLLLVPGLVLGLLFVFVTPVVMIENVGGVAALRRSATLVKANVSQVLVMGLVFAAIRFVASIFAWTIVPRTAFFAESILQDLLLLFLLPIPIVGTVLVYLDVRRQTEGVDAPTIARAALSRPA